MTKNTKAGLSVLLILSGIIGLEIGGLTAIIASLFAIGVGAVGIKNAILN
jgi:hypothetical protein